jgi:hypothetical protein
MDIAQKVLQLKDDLDDVYEAGKKAEYDAFWASALKNLSTIAGIGRFAGECWNDDTFNPPSKITINGNCNYCFYVNTCTTLIDKVEKMNCTALMCTFQYSKIKHICSLDLSNCFEMSSGFASGNIISIEKIISSANTAWRNNVFSGATSLENVIFEGTIGQNGFDIHWSTKLTAESIDSIVRALSPDTTGLTITLPKDAWYTHASYYGGPTTSELWESRSNWSINELAV